MSDSLPIDNLDRKILDIITNNARIPYLEVARECGVSGAAIHQRVQRLMRIGVIKGSEFKVDPVLVGFKTCAYIGIFLEHPGHFRELSRNSGIYQKLLNVTIQQGIIHYSLKSIQEIMNT